LLGGQRAVVVLELERVKEELAQASITDSLAGPAHRCFLTE